MSEGARLSRCRRDLHRQHHQHRRRAPRHPLPRLKRCRSPPPGKQRSHSDAARHHRGCGALSSGIPCRPFQSTSPLLLLRPDVCHHQRLALGLAWDWARRESGSFRKCSKCAGHHQMVAIGGMGLRQSRDPWLHCIKQICLSRWQR